MILLFTTGSWRVNLILLTLLYSSLTQDVEMCRGSDGLVVVGWPHLALEVGVVRETHVDDLEEKKSGSSLATSPDRIAK